MMLFLLAFVAQAALAGRGNVYNAVLAALWAGERYNFALRAAWLHFYGS